MEGEADEAIAGHTPMVEGITESEAVFRFSVRQDALNENYFVVDVRRRFDGYLHQPDRWREQQNLKRDIVGVRRKKGLDRKNCCTKTKQYSNL